MGESRSGSGINIPDHISESLEARFYLLFLLNDRRIRIRIQEAQNHSDPGDPDSDPDPQHCLPDIWPVALCLKSFLDSAQNRCLPQFFSGLCTKSLRTSILFWTLHKIIAYLNSFLDSALPKGAPLPPLPLPAPLLSSIFIALQNCEKKSNNLLFYKLGDGNTVMYGITVLEPDKLNVVRNEGWVCFREI